jgi:hypothetical protein
MAIFCFYPVFYCVLFKTYWRPVKKRGYCFILHSAGRQGYFPPNSERKKVLMEVNKSGAGAGGVWTAPASQLHDLPSFPVVVSTLVISVQAPLLGQVPAH